MGSQCWRGTLAGKVRCSIRCLRKEPKVQDLLASYLPIVIFLAIAVGLGLVLLLSAIVIAVRNPDPEKSVGL